MRIQQIDADTGEILDATIVAVFNRKKVGDRFFMAFQDGFIELAEDREMTSEPMRVLMFLFGKLDFENYIHLRQKTIAERLGMAHQNVSRSMKLLVQKQIILTHSVEGVRCYRLNPNYGWKGRASTLQNHRTELRDRRLDELGKRKFEVIEGGLSA